MDKIIEELLKLLKESLKGKFASYEIGLRYQPGISKLPMLCVYPKRKNTRRSGTGNDDVKYTIGMMVIMSTALTAGIPGKDRKAETQMQLVKAMCGTDDDGKVLDNTVEGVLNGNITINDKVLYTDLIDSAYDSDFPAKGAKSIIEYVTLTFVAHTRPQR